MVPLSSNGARSPVAGASGPGGPENKVAASSADSTSLESVLARLRRGDEVAREELIALACGQMRKMAHRMLRGYPTVRRYDDTDDIVQNALLRLQRALAAVTPESPERFLGLAALQIRRELIDLARMHAGPESHASHHETDSIRVDGEIGSRVAAVPSRIESADALDRWTMLHEAAAALPDDERRLFDLAWYLGVQQEEAAKILGCSVRTVKRRWEYVKATLRSRLPGGPAAPFPE